MKKLFNLELTILLLLVIAHQLIGASEQYIQHVTFINKTNIPVFMNIWDTNGNIMFEGLKIEASQPNQTPPTLTAKAAKPGQYFGKIAFGKSKNRTGATVQLRSGGDALRISAPGRNFTISMSQTKPTPTQTQPDAPGIFDYTVTIM